MQILVGLFHEHTVIARTSELNPFFPQLSRLCIGIYQIHVLQPIEKFQYLLVYRKTIDLGSHTSLDHIKLLFSVLAIKLPWWPRALTNCWIKWISVNISSVASLLVIFLVGFFFALHYKVF